MKAELKLAGETKLYKRLSKNISAGKLFHANLIVGTDEVLSFNVAILLAIKLLEAGAKSPEHTAEKVFSKVHPDLFILGEEKAIDTEAVKDVIDKAQVTSYESDNKVIIIKSFDDVSPIAMNKLLKTLEEPPNNTYFFLLSSNENRILQTILSRVQKFYVDTLSLKEINDYLNKVLSAPDSHKKAIISGGSLTKAIEATHNENLTKSYEFVMDTYLNYNITSQFGRYAKEMEGLKGNIKDVLNIFSSLASQAIRVRINRAGAMKEVVDFQDPGRIASSWPIGALVLVIDAAVKAQEMLDKKTTEQNVIDKFLLRVLEVKLKCRK